MNAPNQLLSERCRRVLLLTGEYPPRRGGVADYSRRLADAVRQMGHQVTVLTTEGSADPHDSAPAQAVWRRVDNWGWDCWRTVESALVESGADVLHIQYQAGAFELKAAVNLLPRWFRLRRPKLRTVTTFHDLLPPFLFPKAGPLRRLAVRELVRGSHAAIYADVADLARAGHGPRRRWVPVGSNIPCAPPPDFDRSETRRALGLAPSGDERRTELLIGFFGFLSESKGAPDLLRALRILLDQGRDVRLVLVGASAGDSNPSGRSDEAEMMALVRQLGLESSIERTGYLPPAAVSANLLACDLLALPYSDGASFRRGSLLAGFEHGRPIVTTTPLPAARGVPPRLLEPGRQFLAVAPGNPSALAAGIARLADDPDLAARLGASARELAQFCAWPAIAQETVETYQGCWDE